MFIFLSFFAMNQFDWPITQKKLETMEAHKCKRFVFEVCRVPPLWPSSIGEWSTTFAKEYGIKVSCYGEHVGELIENLGNVLGM
jgi:hypothetical protein